MFFKLNSKSKCVPCTSSAKCSKALNLCGNPMQAFCSRQCQLKFWGQYSKVIFLDVDCLPRLNLVGGLDKMFEFTTPKAYMRGHWTREHVPSKVRPAWTHADKYGRQKYGINVRVMVLAPNRQDLQRLCEIASQCDHSCHLAAHGPEQDAFLTRHFISKWEGLHVR